MSDEGSVGLYEYSFGLSCLRAVLLTGSRYYEQVLKWICALLRLYTRFFIIKSPWWDDLFVVLALVSSLAYGLEIWRERNTWTDVIRQAATSAGSIAICLSTTVGFGQHFILLGEQKMSEYLKVSMHSHSIYHCVSS